MRDPVNPELPALPQLPTFSDEAKDFPSQFEARLGQMDRGQATMRFMSGNLGVTPEEISEMGVTLGTMVDLTQPFTFLLAYCYYAGLFDGVLLSVAQSDIEAHRTTKGQVN